MSLDRRLKGLADARGWRYTRYADDLTFSVPEGHQGRLDVSAMFGSIKQIVTDEGFQIHGKKTHVARKGSRQKVTGLIVNGDQGPRTPRAVRRMLRAAIHNLEQGKPL